MGLIQMQHHVGSPDAEAERRVDLRGAPWSNKPMVPTAPASPAANPSRPLRRHIGQPSLGGHQWRA